jgi:single-strand selective monofunctional uracil DNA glycosylase
MNPRTDLITLARDLHRAVAGLSFKPPVACVYNPLDYAWPAHEQWLQRFGGGRKRVVFLGMNPGPFGMAQTGVPFGEVAAVRNWLGIAAPIGRPQPEHPRRPVEGFACARSEVSGRRLWGLFAERFGTAERFFTDHFVVNYCPLAFLADSGANLTPDKLPAVETQPLYAACDTHLRGVVAALDAEWVVGVGAFARDRAEAVLSGQGVQIGQILHPSPASPAANRDWAGQATRQMCEQGLWR